MRSAHNRGAFPHASHPLAGLGCGLDIEQDIARYQKIELSIAVVVDKGATRSPRLAIASNSDGDCNFLEIAIALVMAKAVLTGIGDEKIVKAVVIVIAHAHALSPTGELQCRLMGDIGECSVMVVVN